MAAKDDSFEILHRDRASRGRVGLLQTAHGPVNTPAFCPVATAGAVKGITPRQLAETGTEMVLANAYHLMLRPNTAVIESTGGLHALMGWDGPILTDSGGYQIFSMGGHKEIHPGGRPAKRLVEVTDDGVEFTSHIDGSRLFLDPETAVAVQNRLGADIIMCLDECTHHGCGADRLERAVERTVRWASRCRSAHTRTDQLLFGIVQGGTDLNLRRRCAAELVKLNFSGYAIGGLSVGEAPRLMTETAAATAQLLPEHLPRYLMGIGSVTDIIRSVAAGIDMFDCVLPTRNGRNGLAFTERGILHLRNASHAEAAEAIEPGCGCYCCRRFSRAGIRHFFNCREMLGPILVSIHNIAFYQNLMAGIRRAIAEGGFGPWSAAQLKKYGARPANLL
jgi:queuine tRNA-ribosyltransferase